MECPLCQKEMKITNKEVFSTLNPMLISESQECECGLSYDFLEGAERFMKDGKEISIDGYK